MVQETIPLTMASPGKLFSVTAIIAGWRLQRRLADMGLTTGIQVSVMNGQHAGPILLDVRGSRLGLGYGMAQKILVKEVNDG